MAETWDKPLVQKLWDQINLGFAYDWRIKRTVQRRLHEILPELRRDFFETHPEELNRLLRVEISPHLRRAGKERRIHKTN